MFDVFLFAAVIPAYRSLPEQIAEVGSEEQVDSYIASWNDNNHGTFGVARKIRVHVTEMDEAPEAYATASAVSYNDHSPLV